MYKFMNLRRFEEGNGGNGNGNQGNNAGVTYSFEQAEQIATERANRATQSALKSYFAQQGMSEAQVNEALNDYKQKQAANNPASRVAELERQLAEANAQNQATANKATLKSLGVSDEFADFVAYQVGQKVTKDKDFKTAAEEYLKDNAKYKAPVNSYRVASGVSGAQGAGGTETKNESINAAIRSAAGR